MCFFQAMQDYCIFLISFLLRNKILTTAIIGALFENTIGLIAAGSMSKKLIVAIEVSVITTAVSFLFDLLIVCSCYFSIRSRVEKFLFKLPKADKFFHFVKKRGVFAILFYRFIPLARMPVLFSAGLAMNFMSFLIANLIGSILWCFPSVLIGYYGYDKFMKLFQIIKFW